MNDEYKESEKISWWARLNNSFFTLPLGITLVIIAIFLLHFNEGQIDLSVKAKESIEISPYKSLNLEKNNQLASITGEIKSDEKLEDSYLHKGSYLAFSRSIEMYSWVEEKSIISETKVGGSENKTTTYVYSKRWRLNPKNSQTFKKKEGHQNPQVTIYPKKQSVEKASIHNYDFDAQNFSFTRLLKPLSLNGDMVKLRDDIQITEKYLFKGKGSLAKPEIGDIRISYHVAKSPIKNATIFGLVDIPKETLTLSKEKELKDVFLGSRADALLFLHDEFSANKQMTRIAGFLMMLVGVFMVLNPLAIFLDSIPILGTLGHVGVLILSLALSLLFSLLTIITSILFHNIFLLLVFLSVVFYLMFFILKKDKSFFSK